MNGGGELPCCRVVSLADVEEFMEKFERGSFREDLVILNTHCEEPDMFRCCKRMYMIVFCYIFNDVILLC
jgi:hypothetical protein